MHMVNSTTCAAPASDLVHVESKQSLEVALSAKRQHASQEEITIVSGTTNQNKIPAFKNTHIAR